MLALSTRPLATRPAARAVAPTVRHGASMTPTAALPPHVVANVVTTLADAAAKPGSVEAPTGAILLGAAVVTAGMLLLVSGLKPGTDAAEQIFERDRKSGRRR